MPKPKEGENTVEIVETIAETPEAAPTEAAAREQGLSPAEIKIANEHGLLAKEEKSEDSSSDSSSADKEKDVDGNSASGTADKSKDEGGDSNGKGKEEEERRKEGTVRDALDQELDPEKEQEMLTKFNKNEYSLYWRMKKEKAKRQSSDADREHTLVKLKAQEKENETLKARLDALEKDKSGVDDLALDEKDSTVDKPLTEKDLEAREKKKSEEAEKIQSERRERARKLNDVHKQLEIEAKSRYTDFDEAANLAKEIVQAAGEGRLNEMFPDSRTSSRIYRRVQELLAGLVRADEFKEGEYNPADIAYELGQSHPKYGKTSSTTNGKSGKDQALSPEEVDKLARRRTPSAALSGGGGRRVSYDDLTLEDAAKLSDNAFRKLPKETRERLARL